MIILLLMLAIVNAHADDLCDEVRQACHYMGGHSSGSPTRSEKVNINPAAVPVEKGFGLEGILYQSVDFAIVKGLGRVGAALSPANSEDTFFGPPAFELAQDYLNRYLTRSKYPAQKITGAGAFSLINNKRSGLQRFEVNAGVLGKYNTLTHNILPGGGLTGVAGPLTFGFSVYRDQTQINYADIGLTGTDVINYTVQTYSGGIFLQSLALDYSVLKILGPLETATVQVLTASLLLKRAILTYAIRREFSDNPSFDYQTNTLDTVREKQETFLAAQLDVTKHFMIGVFYNYYLLHEFSLGATIFL